MPDSYGPTLEELVATWTLLSTKCRTYNARRAYSRCAEDLKFYMASPTLKDRIIVWVSTRLGHRLLNNRWERAMRVLEEAMELAQAEGVDSVSAMDLYHRVANRPKGDPAQEGAGLNVCLMAWSHAAGVDLPVVTEGEVARIEAMDPTDIQSRQNTKAALGLGLRTKGDE